MSESQITLKGLLALPILLPIALGLTRHKTADFTSRLFVFFLLMGFCTDVTMWILISRGDYRHLLNIFNIYSLVEALFFFWFLNVTSLSSSMRLITKVSLYATLPFWIICIFIYSVLVPGPRSAPFDTTYEIIIAFLAAWALLQRAEKEASLQTSATFWFTLGIFFYCFCTFYIMIFLETDIAQKIWFFNNIVNIISYGFYTVGFWKINSNRAIA